MTRDIKADLLVVYLVCVFRSPLTTLALQCAACVSLSLSLMIAVAPKISGFQHRA